MFIGNSSNPPADRLRQSQHLPLWSRTAIAITVLCTAVAFWFAARWIEHSTANLNFAAISYAGWPLSVAAALAGYYGLKNCPKWLKALLAVFCALAAVIGLAGFLAISNYFICTVPGVNPSRFVISDKFRADPDRKIDRSERPQDLLLNWNFDPAEIYDSASLALIQTALQVTWLVLIIGTMSSIGAWAAIIFHRSAPSLSVIPASGGGVNRWRTPAAALGGFVAASLLMGAGVIGWKLLWPTSNSRPRGDDTVAVRSGPDDDDPLSARNIDSQSSHEFDAEHKWAILIGIDDYAKSGFNHLRYCAADAKLMARQLINYCGFSPHHIILMVTGTKNAKLDPLLDNMNDRIIECLAGCKEGDMVLVFFAGHGILDEAGNGYLVPMDCSKDNAALRAYSTSELRKRLINCKATQKLLILDCCHSGSDQRSGSNAPDGATGQELAKPFKDAKGLITLASCKKAELSNELSEFGHGLFTYIVAEALTGKADYDHDGVVDVGELYTYLSTYVPSIAREQLGAKQNPVIFTNESVGVFALARIPHTDDSRTGAKPSSQ